jgi:hypothetical protein
VLAGRSSRRSGARPRTRMPIGTGPEPASYAAGGPSRFCARAGESVGEWSKYTFAVSGGGSGIAIERLLVRHGEVSSWRGQVLLSPQGARYLYRLGREAWVLP